MDFERFLQPVRSGHGQCGEDMIFSAEFDQIQEARRFEDPSLAQGEWVTEVKEADWENVVRICEEVLKTKSKDLRIAAWLTEARGKIGGLAGLADGYTLLDLLCNTYWDDIHPQPEDGDQEQRTGLLDWLVNQTSRLIRETPLTNSPKGRFSQIDQESARGTAKNIERNPGQAEELERAAHVTLESFEAALKDTPKQHFIDGMRAAEALKDAMGSLQAALDHKMGEHAPAFGTTFDVLDDVYRFYRRQAGDTLGNTPDSTSNEPETSELQNDDVPHETLAAAAPKPSSGPIRSREQAIRQLQEIADFFRRTEPHSPVAYLAAKAARWGTMSLHEWLRTVVKDDAALSRMEELLGVEARQPSEY
ncbi:MAG: ImpA, N-terminal [Proteobacteria bacterium]|nr:ImpA, N-terminal [Pseudomonadota bacterium]